MKPPTSLQPAVTQFVVSVDEDPDDFPIGYVTFRSDELEDARGDMVAFVAALRRGCSARDVTVTVSEQLVLDSDGGRTVAERTLQQFRIGDEFDGPEDLPIALQDARGYIREAFARPEWRDATIQNEATVAAARRALGIS